MPKCNFSYLPPPADGPVVETSRDSVSGVASSVVDLEGIGDDPDVGHEPGVDLEVEDGLVVVEVFVEVFVLFLELHIELLLELELLFDFLFDVAWPVRGQ